ncbi:unnamed protein product [Didymodactylos carnosus]|uniref:Laminin subunit alpha n=1 Tax=Didymodactylos carnosus TaxID=1234261 RepID=A0A814J9T0_9BILA|nr:unnamed protein product [Didymodactylos carnosus]CAF3803805.1 unnamed protein product [Didymodactylos carnosus]
MSLKILYFVFILHYINAELLRPPYLNLAREKHITVSATATCGEFINEKTGKITKKKELYCKLTGSSPYEKDFKDSNLIYGQYCDTCDPNIPDKVHSVNYTIDGTDRWWQSPPLSRGIDYQRVNVTVNLGQEYHVAYVYVKMANSPRPAVWALERSTDYGKTFKTWFYFANDFDCRSIFGIEPVFNRSFLNDDDVVCETKFASRIPLESGEMVISLINERPNAKNFSYSDTLQQWTRATNVRLRLLRPTTLQSHLIPSQMRDDSVTRRYFYSIKDIALGGHCVCNGHAESCDKTDPKTPNKMVCRCRHNTCGDYCQYCCPPFVQKKWKQSREKDGFECEPCQCYGHSNECQYDENIDRQSLSIDIHGNYEGGGRCVKCQHNTDGINCEKCVKGYFRNITKKVSDSDVCQKCKCNLKFSTGNCAEGTGKCECKAQYSGINCDECSVGYYNYPECKPCLCSINGTADHKCLPDSGRCVCKMNYDGDFCDTCAPGYYNYPECQPCECERLGSDGNICDITTGQCPCRLNYQNRTCDTCKNGHFGFPGCLPCVCNTEGTTNEICDKEVGLCVCKQNFAGPNCEQCSAGFYGHPTCSPCNCDQTGVIYDACDQRGQCHCKANFGARQCNQCAPGYYRYPACIPCSCDPHGALGVSCQQSTGQCICKSNYAGDKCQECRLGLFNFPYCEECKCVPAGVRNDFSGCGRHNIPGVLCLCKANVEGRQCDRCKEGHWNMRTANPLGCESCDCSEAGTLGILNVCDQTNGQCPCKITTQGQRCDQCADGYFSLKKEDPFGCEPCRCSLGGALSSVCDKETGQCSCRPNIVGRECNTPADNHYFATLHQFRYEVEDGVTPVGSAARYEFDSNEYKNYSWKGYAKFSALQPEVQVSVQLPKPTAYRFLIHYRSYKTDQQQTDANSIDFKTPQLHVKFVSRFVNPLSNAQNFDIDIPYNEEPSFQAGGLLTSESAPMNDYILTLRTNDPIFIDYVLFIPIEYVEANALQQNDGSPDRPCEIDDEEECYHYRYPTLYGMPTTTQTHSYGQNSPVESVDTNTLQRLGVDSLTSIERGRDYRYDLQIPTPGLYYIVVDYHTLDAENSHAQVQVMNSASIDNKAEIYFSYCSYSFICRQIVTQTNIRKPKILSMTNDGRATVIIHVTNQESTGPIAIQSITAIPITQFTYELLKPQFSCVREDDTPCGEVTNGQNIMKFEAEDYYNQHLKTNQFPGADQLVVNNVSAPVFVVPLNSTMPNIYVYGRLNNEQVDATDFPNNYMLTIHYFQTEHSIVPVNIIFYSRSGDSQIGEIRASLCQRPQGCNQIITLQNGSNSIRLNEPEFTAYLAINPNQSIFIDYITVQKIDDKQQETRLASTSPSSDRASQFVKQCLSKNNYDIKFDSNSNSNTFCRQALVSLSATFNERALPCLCDPIGSKNFTCDQYGGQCSCKSNIIGRRCSLCATGYWGFPDCRPCSCPSKICNQQTGDCICPPRVTGRNCDQCAVNTYGFDPLLGCEDCQCRIEGVVSQRMDCALKNGQCYCRENVAGRTCDHCASGHFNYPHCMKCDCDQAGTVDSICDPYTGTCLCKENVYGPRCDQCKPATFALQDDNPKGCTKCYCFGTTNNCRGAQFSYRIIRNMSDWTLTNPALRHDRKDGRLTLYATPSDGVIPTTDDDPLYWIAPRLYLGNKILTYGGNLTFKINYATNSPVQNRSLTKPLVLLRGRDLTIAYFHPRPIQSNRDEDIIVPLKELYFKYQVRGGGSGSSPITRETFIQVLSNITNSYILAGYNPSMTSTTVAAVQLHHADPKSITNGTRQAKSVEVCACPPNYAGLSCETCARGFYKQYQGLNNWICIPCNCNGYSDTCDIETGKCLYCRNNTAGSYCDTCRTGYNGDPTRQIPCRICACPLSLESNNFASSCEMNALQGETTRCFCQQGYYGDRCQSCYPAYWGEPSRQGSRCTLCECNGNIDLYDWNACDQKTGKCISCLNNTAGDHCERCRDWFYGDALRAKSCQQCQCAQCGSNRCDGQTGRCSCKQGVTGPRCDQCLENHYGYHLCDGCKTCDCAVGAKDLTCDTYTGQCQCKPGVTGRKCDVCMTGYWDLTIDGCKQCQCDRFGTIRHLTNTGLSCDANTGKCFCIEGVRGERCDQCEEYYTIVEGRGCLPCDKSNIVPEGWCSRQLIDDVDQLRINLNKTIDNANKITQGRTASERVEKMKLRANNYRNLANNSTLKTRCEYDQLSLSYPANVFCLNEHTKNLTQTLNSIDTYFKQILIDVNYEQDQVKSLMSKAEYEHDRVKEQVEFLEDFADDIDVFSTNLTQHGDDDPTYVIHLIDSVQQIMDQFQIDNEQDTIDNYTIQIDLFHDNVKLIEYDLQETMNNINQLQNQTIEFEQRTKQMEKLTNNANDKLNRINNQLQIFDEISLMKTKLKQSLTLKNTSDTKLINITTIKNDMNDLYNDLQNTFKLTTINYQQINQSMNNLNSKLNDITTDNNRVRTNIRKIYDHVRNISETSNYLQVLYDNMKRQTNYTLYRIFVFKNIIDSVNSLDKTTTDLNKNLTDTYLHVQQKINQTNLIVENLVQHHHQDTNNLMMNNIEQQQLVSTNNHYNDRIDKINRSATVYSRSLETSEKQLPSYKLRIDELKQTADNLEPDSNRIYEESERRKAEFETLKEKILAEKPMNSSKLSDKPLQMEFRDTEDTILKMKNWEATADEQLSTAKYTYDQTVKLQEDIFDIVNEIHKLIEESRSIVSAVRVGASFNRSTGVSLHKPSSFKEANIHSKLSLSFRTREPNGLLAYVGNEANNELDSKPNYMALKLNEHGQLEFNYDLGFGEPSNIVSSQQFIDNQWYDVTVERYGPHGQLTVMDANGTDIFTGASDAQSGLSLLDLHPNRSVLLIGGVPTQVSISQYYQPFAGSISDVRFNDQPISLWNFETSTNHNQGVTHSLSNREAIPGISMNGNGYVLFSKRRLRKLEQSFTLTIIFKTNSPTGLLLAYGGIEKRFFAVQIIDTHPEILMNTGSGLVNVRLVQSVHDNRPHRLHVKKLGSELTIQLDDNQAVIAHDRDEESRIDSNEDLYVGKYLGQDSVRESVTNRGFSGCIQSIHIDRIELTLKSTEYFKKMENVEKTCTTEQIVRTIQFGYVYQEQYAQIGAKNLTIPWAITLRVRIQDQNGTLIYFHNTDNDYLSLTIENGHIIVRHLLLPTISLVQVKCTTPLAKSGWNYISLHRNQQQYTLFLNDVECGSYEQQLGNDRYQFHQYNSVFIGGLPVISSPSEITLTNKNLQKLIGCIGDVNIDGTLINFNNIEKLKNADQNCQLYSTLTPTTSNDEKSLIPPEFSYNATQPSYPDGFRLKFRMRGVPNILDFNDTLTNNSTESDIQFDPLESITNYTQPIKNDNNLLETGDPETSSEEVDIEIDVDEQTEPNSVLITEEQVETTSTVEQSIGTTQSTSLTSTTTSSIQNIVDNSTVTNENELAEEDNIDGMGEEEEEGVIGEHDENSRIRRSCTL